MSVAAAPAQVLVVDDEPDLRTLYELTLLREGYRVEAAGTLAEAWQQLDAKKFDAVITDMRLPDGQGLELLQRMAAQQRAERCIVMTAYGSAENAVEALKAQPGDELQVWGSGRLLQMLLQHKLVDRFRLMTFPVVLGSGRRLFNDGILPTTMRPVDVAVTDLGIVLGTYEPAGPVRYGEM